MKLISKELEQRFAEIGEQNSNENPLVIAKFFDPAGSATWYATEYDKETNTCFGYVTGLIENEWGAFSISELEQVHHPFGLGIERDIFFKETRFDDLFKRKARLEELEEIKNTEELSLIQKHQDTQQEIQ